MATNGTELAAELRLDEEIYRISKSDLQSLGSSERSPSKRGLDHWQPESEHSRGLSPETLEPSETFALAPLVNKIAFGMARGLVVALKELENHIAVETRKVGDTVDRRLDTLNTTLQELSGFMGAQRMTNAAVESRIQELNGALEQMDSREAADVQALRSETAKLAASLNESEARQSADAAKAHTESKELIDSVSRRIDDAVTNQQECDKRQSAALASLETASRAFQSEIAEKVDHLVKELGVQQEDIGAIKTTLGAFSARVQGLAERLDRQADTVRSMCSAYSQRETELEQLVDGLARLRSFPTPMPANGI